MRRFDGLREKVFLEGYKVYIIYLIRPLLSP